MSVAIGVEGLSKRYRLGEYHAAYGTLRETLCALRGAARPAQRARRARRRSGRSSDVTFQVPEGEVLGVIGRERRGQVDAAEDPHADHDADRRASARSAAASAACSRSVPASTRS